MESLPMESRLSSRTIGQATFGESRFPRMRDHREWAKRGSGNDGSSCTATKQRGFSLIELLIVVAIILIIAAFAIPNLLRARIAANESSAVASVRTINSAMITYN